MAEERISRLLRSILAELSMRAYIPDSEQFSAVLSDLEWFIPAVLGEVYPEWTGDSLDGIYPVLARKAGDGEAVIFGHCIMINDQTLTPIHLRLQINRSTDRISWLECRLGEKGQHGMLRMPYESLNATSKRLHALDGRSDAIDWVYKVTFGHRQVGRIETK